MLILTGLQDLMAVPENGLKLAKQRPNTWLVGLPNCGHNMVFEQPEALKKLILEFIESVVAGANASATKHSQTVVETIKEGKTIYRAQ